MNGTPERLPRSARDLRSDLAADLRPLGHAAAGARTALRGAGREALSRAPADALDVRSWGARACGDDGPVRRVARDAGPAGRLSPAGDRHRAGVVGRHDQVASRRRCGPADRNCVHPGRSQGHALRVLPGGLCARLFVLCNRAAGLQSQPDGGRDHRPGGAGQPGARPRGRPFPGDQCGVHGHGRATGQLPGPGPGLLPS